MVKRKRLEYVLGPSQNHQPISNCLTIFLWYLFDLGTTEVMNSFPLLFTPLLILLLFVSRLISPRQGDILQTNQQDARIVYAEMRLVLQNWITHYILGMGQ